MSDLDELTTDVMYLQDGKLHLYQPVESIKQQTGETRLEKAIAQVMKRYLKDGAATIKMTENREECYAKAI